jgi:ABC-3C biological conflict system middle component
MLTPRKHLNLDVSVLRISALMLRELRRRGVVEFEPLRKLVVRRVGADGELSFLPALGFLFLLGKVEYHLKNDTIEYKVG